MRHRAAAFGGAVKMGLFPDGNRPQMDPECSCDASLAAKHEIQASLKFWKNIVFEVPVLPKSTLRLLAAKAPVGSLDIDPTGLLQACGAHARRVWAAEQPAPPCSTRKLTRS